jgi:hypothetical protein
MCAERPQRYRTLRLNSVTPAMVYIVGFASVRSHSRKAIGLCGGSHNSDLEHPQCLV